MRRISITLAAILMLWSGIPALAHHSAALQDFTKRVEISGVVKAFRIMNPHGKLLVEVSDPKGKREIEFETHSRNNVYRSGYRDGMIKPGEKIKVTIAPNRDGSDGGYVVGFETAKGEKVGLDPAAR
jgi:hypothetical protein